VNLCCVVLCVVVLVRRPPRAVDGDHLVDGRLLFFAYFNIGMIESLSSFLVFFHYLSAQGIPSSGVWLAFDRWQDGYYGKSQEELNELVFTGQSIFFLSLVITQFGNLLSSRTRRMSITQQNPFYGPARNSHIFGAIVLSTLIAVVITQVKWFNDTFNTRPVPAVYIAPAIGFAGVIMVYDEIRKFIIRRYPNSFVAKIAW
jgi:sodium/potassium-transporting ATPase subunit alpha